MVLWFVGPSILIVWAVFSSPAADYRFVALGQPRARCSSCPSASPGCCTASPAPRSVLVS